jgi:hypothetical protein
MDVIGHLASELAGLPAILGIARGYVAALVVVAEALPHWTGAIVMAVAGFALVSPGAHAQNRIDEVTWQATAPVDEAPVMPAVRTDQQAQDGKSEEPGSAIYSPFSAGAIAQQKRPRVAFTPSIAPEPGLMTTLAASTAGAVVLVWLLQRI